MKPDREPTLTVEEAAAYLQKSRSWTYRHQAALGARLAGRSPRFTVAALDAYLDGRAVTAAADPIRVLPPVRPQQRPVTQRRAGTNPVTGLEWGALG